MLTAWDKVRDVTLALPDFESGGALETLRARTTQGELVCPTCHQLLWVHAGEVLIPHFAHRTLSNCPLGRVTEAVLSARRLLYRFFQARIESGKLLASIVLEPTLAGLPNNVRVDLLLRRANKPAVTVMVIERGLKPEVRNAITRRLAGKRGRFCPVFLRTRLQHPKDNPELLLLDTTQREFRQSSTYDLWLPDDWAHPGTLHFIDPAAAEWTTLRGLSLVHGPQVFRARRVRISKLDKVLWSEGHAEWVHPGEPETLKRYRRAIEAKKRREAEEQRRFEEALEAERRRQAEARRAMKQRQATQAAVSFAAPAPQEPKPTQIGPAPPGPVKAKEPEPMPAWITGGLVCVACGRRTTDWQNAAPDKDQCICKACFAAGARLR